MAKKIAAPARFALFCLLLFLSVSVPLSAFSFTEYAYLLREESPSAWRYFLSGYSCEGFAKPFLYPTALTASREFSSTLSSVEAARQALARAAWLSGAQIVFSAGGLPGLGVYRVASYGCFGEGGSAYRYCISAVKNAFNAIDGNSATLEKMVSPEYEGMAGGVLSELNEIRSDVELRRDEGEGIGKQLVSRSASSELIWGRFALGQATSSELFNECDSLAGRESLLSDLITLNEKIKAGIASLEEEKTLLENEFEEKKFLAENAVGKAEKEKLSLVGESAFELVGGASIVSSEYGISSFEEDLENATEALALAEMRKGEAARFYSKKQSGYASKSIIALRNAVAELAKARSIAEKALERSEWLENALRQRVLQEQEKTRKAIEDNRVLNPYAAAAAQFFFEKDYGGLTQRLASRGERIAFYLKEISELLSLQKLASSPEGVRSEKSSVEAVAKGLEKLIEKAEKDGLDVEFEKNELKDIKQALARLGDGAENAAQIYLLKNDLLELREGIVAQAQEKYGFLLAKEYALLKELEPALTDSQKLALENAGNYFNAFGELETEKVLGNLLELKNGFEKTLADADLRLPEILKKHLEENALLTVQYEESELDEPATLYVKIVFKNLLFLSYPKPILVELSEFVELVSEGYELVAKTDGVLDVTAKGVLLQKVEENGEYEATIKSSKKIAEKIGEVEETVFANERLAEKKTTINFNSAVEDAIVLARKRLDYSTTLVEIDSQQDVLGTDSRKNADGSTEFTALMEARKGRNGVSFYYEIDSPIEVTKTLSATNNSLLFSYAFRNRYADLNGVEISVFESLGCEPKKTSVTTKLRHEEETREKTFSARFSATQFDARETKTADVSIECDSLSEAASEKLSEVELLVEAWNASEDEKKDALEKISEARQKISARDYAAAIRLLFEAEEIVKKSEEKELAQERGALEASLLLSRLSALENETQNQVYALAQQGFADEADALQKKLDDARKKISDGRLSEAQEILENALEEIVRKKLLELQEKCLKQDCPLEASDALNKAFGFIAAKDFGSAISKANEADDLLNEKRKAKTAETDAKRTIIQKFPSVKQATQKIFDSFDSAFEVGDELLKERKKSLAFQQGSDARSRAEEIIGKLEDAWTAFETGDRKFDKTSLAFLNNSLNELGRLQNSLAEKISETRREAEEEIGIAKMRQKQFGNDGTAKTLELAQNEFDNGRFFAALAYAKQVNKLLRGPASSQENAGITNETAKILLGLVGIAILAVLVYVIVLKNKPAPKKREI